MSLVAIFPTGFWMSSPFKTGVWHQMLKEKTIAKCSESSVLCGITKTRFCGKLSEPARRALGNLAAGPFLCYSFNTNNGLYLLCPRSWTSCTLCVPCWISRHLTTFSRVWRSSAADQLHLSLGGVSTMSQVCLRSILFKSKSCICSNTFHRCHFRLALSPLCS